jgi:hypothetical protein
MSRRTRGAAWSGKSDDSGREIWNGNDHESSVVHEFGRQLRIEAGDRDEISAVIDEKLERAERDQAFSMIAKLLRIRGELLLLQDSPDPKLARECFMRSIECARAQGALSWELRTAPALCASPSARYRIGRLRLTRVNRG